MKIAVIDDEQGIRSLLRDVLDAEGYDVVEAHDGVSGLELIRSTLPDLIVCDINMPGMTGDELFQSLRENDSDLGLIPFIFLSGNINTNEEIKRLNKGADICLTKPINLKLLVAHIKAQLSRVVRMSDFINKKLDNIADLLPQTVEYDFSSYKTLSIGQPGYVDALVSAIGDYCKMSANQGFIVETKKETSVMAAAIESQIFDELAYIQYCLSSFKERRELVRAANGEDLSWTLIFMVVQAQLKELVIYVSDLYVSIPSAKSTINARISSLIEDKIFTKENDLADGRRQKLSLTDDFREKLINHIGANIALMNQI